MTFPHQGDGEYEDVNLVEARAPTMKATATTSVLKTVVSGLAPEENIVDALGEGEKMVVDAASKDALSVMLKVEPPKATFKSTGGLSNHTLTNKGNTRLVFKIKCSNNNDYGIHPVYGFIEPMSSSMIMITRLPGNPKEDKAVIQWVEAPADAKDPKEEFKNTSPWTMQSVKLALAVVADTQAAPKEKSVIQPVIRGKPSVASTKAAKEKSTMQPVSPRARPSVPSVKAATKEKSTMQPVSPRAKPSAPSKVAVPSPKQVAAPVKVPAPAVPAAPVKVPAPAVPAAPVKVPAPAVPAAPVKVPAPAVPAPAAAAPAVAAIKPLGFTIPPPAVPVTPPKPVQIKPVPAPIKIAAPALGTPSPQPPAAPIAPIKPLGFQQPISPAPATPPKPGPPAPFQKPFPIAPTTPPKPTATVPAPPLPKVPVSKPTISPATPSTPVLSKRPAVITPLHLPGVSHFPVPEGPPPAPAKGTTDGLPVVSVYAVGGGIPGYGSSAPKSIMMPGMSPTSKPRK